VLPVVNDVLQQTACSICGGVDDEDLIILCDGPGCANEIHMYCLVPALTSLPDGDWYCDACDPMGSTVQLKAYFESFSSSVSCILPTSAEEYRGYLCQIQQRQIPLNSWRPLMRTGVILSEFDAESADILGSLVRLTISESQSHTGRIINRRYDENLHRWEHLAQFKRYDSVPLTIYVVNI
jgi:hypothetical protein